MKRLLSTKVLPESIQGQLVTSGWELTQYDAISVELLPVPSMPEDRIAVFTSKHAVRACLESNPDRDFSGVSCLCVGDTTGSLLRDKGGAVLETADSATALASLIEEKYTDESFIYFCGNRRLETIPETLDKLGLDWVEVIAYQTKTVEKSFSYSFEGILFFSPSGVQSFTSANPVGNAIAYCIGPTTADEAKKHTKRLKIAESPGVAALIALVNQCINPVKN